jgi:competence protein ComFA
LKAYVYLLKQNEEWTAWMTLSPEVDYAYWFGRGSAWQDADCAWYWQEPLPLGQAAEAARLWKERGRRGSRALLAKQGWAALWDRGETTEAVWQAESVGKSDSRSRKQRRAPGEAEAVGRMSRLIDEIRTADLGRRRNWLFDWGKGAVAECYEGGGLYGGNESEESGGKCGYDGDRPGLGTNGGQEGRREVPLQGKDRGGIGEMRKAAAIAGNGCGSIREAQHVKALARNGDERCYEGERVIRKGRRRSVVRWSVGDGRQVMDADRWSHVAAIAKLAAGLLQGRALLSVEARALLASAAVPGAEANWSEAIQLAALLGQVRLSGSVAAPEGKRADARRRLRCMRCGSGEAHLRRAPCMSCGRDCAYCEACILMGRSRECELLIRGMYDSPVWKEQGLGRWKALRRQPMPERLGKWGLSPAQREATAKALHFLEEHPVGERMKGTRVPRLSNTLGRAITRFMPSGRSRKSGASDMDQQPGDDESDTRPLRGNQKQRTRTVIEERYNYSGRREGEGERTSKGTSNGISKGTSGGTNSGTSKGTSKDNGSKLHVVEAGASSTRSSVLGEDRPSPDRSFLIWAVTGAGKTEMVFPLVESIISRGGRALIASPRRDVVLELDPRIRKAFPASNVVTLYGGSDQRWDRGEITLSTTHQLIRFHEAFDLVIVDEIDAFPYHGDPMLYFAADKSRLPGAPKLLLSATPPRELQYEAKQGRLAHARVPVRYHRHPLPVPKLLRSPSVRHLLAKGSVPASLLHAIRHSLGRGAQVFLFVQRISESEPMAALLRKQLPTNEIEATSSKDPDRANKVIRFRTAETRLLVTTTILERGVTVPRSDVFILDADGKLFDEASLVQMAGRAGRSADDPAGKVYFIGPARTVSQLRAVRHIRGMNRIAARKGFLFEVRRSDKQKEKGT